MWVQTQKLTHTNLIFLGWVELLKTHRIIQPGLDYDELGWVQPTSFRRVESSERRDQREKRVKNSEELVQLVRVKDVKQFVDQALNHHFRQQSRRYELRSTIQNNNAEHSKNDY